MIYSSLRNFALHVAIGVTALFVAIRYIDGVFFQGEEYIVLIAGTVLGFINFFIKPLIKIITIPLRIITLGLFTFFINISIIWFVQSLFLEINIEGFLPLLYTTLLVCVLEITFYSLFSSKK